MDTQQALLRAILLNPADDTPRLVYADWLDEGAATVPCPKCKGAKTVADYWGYATKSGAAQKTCSTCRGTGNGVCARAARAEFIRVQIAAHSSGEKVGSMALWNLLHSSEHWFTEPCKACRIDWDDWGVMHDETVHWEYKHNTNEFFARRGFVSEIRVSIAAFMEHAQALFSAHPIERVTLTDKCSAPRPAETTVPVWQKGSVGMGAWYGQPGWRVAYMVPDEVFEFMPQGAGEYSDIYRDDQFVAVFPATTVIANQWLSDACVAYGRSLAGLPPLPGTAAG